MKVEQSRTKRPVTGVALLSPSPATSSSYDDCNDDDSFVESPGSHAESTCSWPPCKCPQHGEIEHLLENSLDVDLLSADGCKVDAPKSRRRLALWVAGAVLFVAGIAGGFFLTEPLTSSHSFAGRNSLGGGRTRHGPVLVYSSDDDQQAGVIASIRSVQMHASGPVEFLYIGNKPLPGMEDMPQVRFRKLSQVVKTYKLEEFTNPTYARSGKNSELNTEPSNYVRFVVQDLLPKQDKVMWIDADTIVECDVVELFKNTFAETTNSKDEDSTDDVDEDHPRRPLPAVAAVPREGYPIGLSGRGRRIYGDEKISFNAGVYLMELNRWRAQKLTDKIRQITLSNRYENWYYTGSQPPLALAVGTNFEHLPDSWNVKMKNVKLVDGAIREEVCLMHWAGPNKPWYPGHSEKIHSEFWLTYGTQVGDKALEKDAQ